MEKILILGSNGMLGSTVCDFFKKKNLNIIESTRKDFDVEKDDISKLINIFQNVKYIINCIGLIPHTNIIDENRYIKINTEFPLELKILAEKYNIKLIHITTDCVFDGTKGDYIETDFHSEKEIYGVSKSKGEPECCVIRTSIIGRNNKGYSFLEWALSNKDKEINGYVNHLWNGMTCLELSKVLYDIIVKDLYWIGVRHVFSEETISKYDLLLLINEIYNLNLKVVPYISPRTIKRNLCSIFKKSFNICPLKEQLIELLN